MRGAIPITALTDKSIGYCAVTPNKKFMKLFERANVQNILISYHYIKKDKAYTKDILQMIRDRGGLFMTDSGIFSFANDKKFKAADFEWEKYVNEYVEWLHEWKEYIFSACNLDADNFIVTEDVRRWNEDLFEPLLSDINIVFVAHKNTRGRGELDAFKEYTDKYSYVGVNESLASQASAIYSTAKKKNVAIHGLAWTKPSVLRDYPFFSVDSSSWVNYQKYGATPAWDGTNFSQYDKDNKDIRKTLKNQCNLYGVGFKEFCTEKNPDGSHNDDEGLTFSLRTWLDVFQDLKDKAKNKLTITLADLLDNKITVFKESPLAAKQAPPPAPAGPGNPVKKGLGNVLADRDDVGEPVDKTIAYQETESGDLVPVYNKREKISITDAKAMFGDSLMCNSCHISDKCPKKEQDASCAFDFAPTAMTESPFAVINMLIKAQTERVNRALFFENMEGGNVNKIYSQELQRLQDLNNTRVNMLILAKSKQVYIGTDGQAMAIGDTEEGEGQKQLPTGGFAALLAGMMQADTAPKAGKTKSPGKSNQ